MASTDQQAIPEKYCTPPPVFSSVLTERYLSNNSATFVQLHEEDAQKDSSHMWGTMCGLKYSWKSPVELVHFDDLPDWIKDNEFVQTCNRSCLPIKQAFKSVFQVHTETGNIWTHLLATLFSIWFAIYILPQAKNTEAFVSLCFFFFGSTTVYVCSTLYHTLYVCSYSISQIMGKVDYAGVVVGIWGCECACVITMFECPSHRWSLLVIITVLAFTCFALVVLDRFSGPSVRVCRTLIFALFGIFGIVPMITFATINNSCYLDNAPCASVVTRTVVYLGSMGATFLSGAALYALRIPERWWPGKFDLIGHSHQIWHVSIVVGFNLVYVGLIEVVNNKHLLPALQCSA